MQVMQVSLLQHGKDHHIFPLPSELSTIFCCSDKSFNVGAELGYRELWVGELGKKKPLKGYSTGVSHARHVNQPPPNQSISSTEYHIIWRRPGPDFFSTEKFMGVWTRRLPCGYCIIMAPSKCRTRAITNFEIGYNPHKICIDNQLSAEKLPSNYTQPRAENMIQSEKWLPSKDIK
jgi:hypothetical protein